MVTNLRYENLAFCFKLGAHLEVLTVVVVESFFLPLLYLCGALHSLLCVGVGGWGDFVGGSRMRQLLKFVSRLHFRQTIPKKYLVVLVPCFGHF